MVAIISTVTIGADVFSVYALTADPNADTDSFWNGRLGAEKDAYEGAAEDDQNRAIVMAADWLDRASSYSGDKTVATQPREWPRDGALNHCLDEAIADGTIPDDIFAAQSWLAGVILADASAASSSGEGSNVKQAKAGSASVTFFTPTTGTGADFRLPQVAHDYNKCYTQSAPGVSAPVITGTEQPSSFCEDDYGLNKGLS